MRDIERDSRMVVKLETVINAMDLAAQVLTKASVVI